MDAVELFEERLTDALREILAYSSAVKISSSDVNCFKMRVEYCGVYVEADLAGFVVLSEDPGYPIEIARLVVIHLIKARRLQ